MAVIQKDAAYMGFPLSIKRGNPAPVDTTAVWYDKTELEAYAASGATAYVGQVLTYVDSANSTCEAYLISNTAGTLVKLASTTASGDLASDVATLQGQVADLIDKVGEDGDEATGLYAKIAEVKALAEAKVASVAAGDNSITIGGTATAPTVSAKISAVEGNSLSVKDDGLFVEVPEVELPEYKLVAATTTTGMLKSYKLTKDGADITGSVVIDIPKDMVVKGGTVETYTEGNLPTGVTEVGTYIVITLSNDDKLYVKADGLVDIYGGGTAADGIITVNVDPATKTITATIGDGKITKAKLAAAVQSSLDKADSAIQSVATGSADGTISVDGADVAVKGLADAAYATVESLNATAKSYADTAEANVIGKDADASTTNTIKGAKKYADEKAKEAEDAAKTAASEAIAALDVDDTAVAGQFVSSVSEVDGKISVARKALVSSDIPELAIAKVTGLQDALDAKQDSVLFDGTYSASNKAATVGTVNTAVAGVVTNGADTAADDTIKGAKLYADGKASDALASAKSYADSLVNGDDGIAKRVDALESKVDVTKVSTAIADAKTEAIEDAASKDAELKTAILGEEAYAQTVKSVYELAASKATIADVEAKNYATKTEAQGYADAKDAAIAEAKKAGTDAMAKIGTIPEGSAATTAIDYVDEKIDAIPAQVDYSVTCDTSTPAGVAKRYILSQKGSEIVTIDIPKDMVVESGTVETDPAGQPKGTYLVLTLANATSDKVYINVGDLIEYVTGDTAKDGIITTAVDANHVLTATINDGTITKAKLAAAVQTSLGKADTALQAADLEPYAKTEDVAAGYVAKNGTDRLMTADEGTKLAGIDEGAQVNKIESVKVGGTALTITDKAVDITEISTDLLKQGADTLVLKGGNAATLAG